MPRRTSRLPTPRKASHKTVYQSNLFLFDGNGGTTNIMAQQHGIDLLPVLTLLAAGVIAGPLFKRLGLGSVLGYVAGGIVIGPFALGVFVDPAAILQVAELGIVMFLFLVGLEMRPSRLWSMRRQIFGLGLAQVVLCASALTLVGLTCGMSTAMAFVAACGFVLTSTAIVMQMLEERGELGDVGGQKIVSILLLEDLMIVPFLVLVAFLAPAAEGAEVSHRGFEFAPVVLGLVTVAGVVLAGRFILSPMFGVLANARAREVMSAAALLVVLGAAYAMEQGGLSMAMGAFIAGVLLSGSSYRHQLEADVEPFRGILLGLFFLAIGMSLDLGVVAQNWRSLAFYVVVFMAVKGATIYMVARFFRSTHADAASRAVLMAQGGEFAFVLYAAATSTGLVDLRQNALLTAVVILSMMLTPLLVAAHRMAGFRSGSAGEGAGGPDSLTGTALVIGFGRVGQIASQFLLARDYEISIIDIDVEMIEVARNLEFDVYYGDGTRLDILHAAGAGRAKVALVCIDDATAATRITRLLKAQFPSLPVLVRAKDRVHSLELIRAGADTQVRETFESAVSLGMAALQTLGVTEAEVTALGRQIRERDDERLKMELTGGPEAGRAFFSGRSAWRIADDSRPDPS